MGGEHSVKQKPDHRNDGKYKLTKKTQTIHLVWTAHHYTTLYFNAVNV